jgi:hypothetical protein
MQTEMFEIADSTSPRSNATRASESSTLFIKPLSLSTAIQLNNSAMVCSWPVANLS